jgi:hypothetical protein
MTSAYLSHDTLTNRSLGCLSQLQALVNHFPPEKHFYHVLSCSIAYLNGPPPDMHFLIARHLLPGFFLLRVPLVLNGGT